MTHGILARVVRSGFVEGEHHGSAVALGPDGAVLAAVGDPSAPIFPRSAAKPLQALAMLRCGLVVDDARLALACSSHLGEPVHLEGVTALLADAGLEPCLLAAPPDVPGSPASAAAWAREGRPAASLAHNCSGKHAAMLATCAANGWPLTGYLDPGHPLQQAIAATVADLTGDDVAATGVDGCGAPVLAVSAAGLARAFGRLTAAAAGTDERRVADAMRAHPLLVGGSASQTTAVMRAVPGLLAKEGADGIFAAALPSGAALAMKVADGSARARAVVLAAWLRLLEDDLPGEPGALDAFADAPVWGGGRRVGAIEPAVPVRIPG